MCFSKQRQGLCGGLCNSSPVTAAEGAAEPGGGRLGAAVGISLGFGKSDFCPEVLGGHRGGRGTPPCAGTWLRLGLAPEPEWQRIRQLPADTFLWGGAN